MVNVLDDAPVTSILYLSLFTFLRKRYNVQLAPVPDQLTILNYNFIEEPVH